MWDGSMFATNDVQVESNDSQSRGGATGLFAKTSERFIRRGFDV